MEAKDFATRLVKRLRKRSQEVQHRSQRHNPLIAPNDIIADEATAEALSETADCIEEALATFDE